MGKPRFIWVGAIFSAVKINSTSRIMCGILPDCSPPGEEVGTVLFRLFPRPLCHMHEVHSRGNRGGNQRIVLHKRANFVIAPWGLRRLICTCGAPPCLQPPARVFVLLLSRFSSTIYLWLKPHLVVKISSDIVTEYCCQVCVLSMMFCHSDSRLCADMVSW